MIVLRAFFVIVLAFGLPLTVNSGRAPRTQIITPSAIRVAVGDFAVRNAENVNLKQERLLENSLHWKTDPCDNFLHYACGNWPYFLDSDIEDNLHIVEAKINGELRDLFENSHPAVHEPNFMQQVHVYYKSCEAIDRKQPPNPLQYLEWLRANENLIWTPFGDSYDNGPTVQLDWLHMVAILRKYGLNNLIIHEETIQHPLNNTKMVLAIKKPFADSASHFLSPLQDENRKFTLWNISDVLDYRKFDEFDLELKEVVIYHAGVAASHAQLITVERLKELHLEWLERYLSLALHPARLQPQMEIYIQDVEYLKVIKGFLDEIDPHFLAQYVQLNFLNKITNRFQDPGYYDCTKSSRLLFPLVVQWLYKHLHPEVSQEFYKMQLLFANLKHLLRGALTSNLPNFNSKVADFFVSKLAKLKLHVLDVWQPALEHFYRGMSLQPTDYIGNRLKVQNMHFTATHSHLTANSVVRGALEFLHRGLHDNADSMLPFLVPRQNLVVLPVTLLQFPLYHPQYNDTFIYSSLGFLLAQEIENSFDDNNLKVDANGNLNAEFVVNFWTSLLEDNGAYDFDEARREIAATNALQLVYQAFSVLYPVAGDEAKLFLLNFAQMHCSNYRKFPDHMKIVNTAVQSFMSNWNVFGCDFEAGGLSVKREYFIALV